MFSWYNVVALIVCMWIYIHTHTHPGRSDNDGSDCFSSKVDRMLFCYKPYSSRIFSVFSVDYLKTLLVDIIESIVAYLPHAGDFEVQKPRNTHATIEVRCCATSSAPMNSLARNHVTCILCGQRRDRCYTRFGKHVATIERSFLYGRRGGYITRLW
jgi:hypothetical protein